MIPSRILLSAQARSFPLLRLRAGDQSGPLAFSPLGSWRGLKREQMLWLTEIHDAEPRSMPLRYFWERVWRFSPEVRGE